MLTSCRLSQEMDWFPVEPFPHYLSHLGHGFGVYWGRTLGKAPFDSTWAAQPPSVETASRSLFSSTLSLFALIHELLLTPVCLWLMSPAQCFIPPPKENMRVRKPKDVGTFRELKWWEKVIKKEKWRNVFFLIVLWGLRPSLVAILMWHNMMMMMGQFISSMHVLKTFLKLCGLWFSRARRLLQSQLWFTSVAS